MEISLPIAQQALSPPSDLLSLGYHHNDLERLNFLINWRDDTYDTFTTCTDQPLFCHSLFTPLLNQVPQLGRFFQQAFAVLPLNGYFICRLETNDQRKKRLLRSLPIGVSQVCYAGDYVLHRVTPRVFPIKKLYRAVFPSMRALSKAEILGRLYHAGFTVRHTLTSEGALLIIAQKSIAAAAVLPPSSEGVILRLRRIGRFGIPFSVYKLRTMHPYSEYLQAYLIETNGLEAGGKFKDDFRISTLGKWLRKYWIDELPMGFNWLKGDLKLVGVRPISAHYLSLYPEELQKERVKQKPGLIPPYYADLPRNFTEIVESELRYLRAYSEAPITTDCRYFLKVLYNIFWRSARSK
ncbi:sugar transferase [Tellurirhabdus bombi]|uniref:sugar transferase n=1 Tax=Tellurirhabdus bombi TaxID=2907205 RepID=UPI001F177D69|nr:sugar transferase [Tellurirhabdus bombi]